MATFSRLLLCSLLLCLCTSCNQRPLHDHSNASNTDEAPFSGDYPIKVVATTGPVAELMKRIGGRHVEVTALMGPGVDPHLYRPVPADLNHLEEADLIVYNGLHLEGRMGDAFEKFGKRKAVWAVTDELVESGDDRLIPTTEAGGHFDPHVWHDPVLWADCVKQVAERFRKFDPTHEDDYVRNAGSYAAQLRSLDEQTRDKIQEIPADQRVLVTAHDAFSYFAKTYGLETEALQGISTDDEVDIGRMDEVVSLLVDRKIPAVFVESAVAPRIVEALVEPCNAQGHEVTIGGELYADAFGPPNSGADSYVGMLTANVSTIVDGLTAKSE